MLENGFWKVGQKTHGHTEFQEAAQNSTRPRIFRSIVREFGKCKIACPNKTR